MKVLQPLLLLSLLVYPFTICAQVTIVDITTDSVSLFNQNVNSGKSANLAMAASAAIPGLGQQYLGKNQSALVFFSVDVLSLFGAIFFEKYSRQLERDAHGYAALHAGVDSRHKGEHFWNSVGNYTSMKDYNNTMDLDRQKDMKFNNESMYWYWEDDSYQNKYKDFRDNSRKVHTVASVFIAAMIVNRIASIVQIKAATRYKSEPAFSSMRMQPTFTSDFSSVGLTLKSEF